MAEGQRRLPFVAGFGNTVTRISDKREVAFALQWFGVPLAALLGLVGALYYVLAPDVLRPTFDDSYISLNFARNIVEHGKLTFDGEEWTTGATSPLHVLIMAFWLAMGVDEFVTSVYVGVASHALLAVGVYLMTFAIFRSRLAGVLAALAISFTSFAALDAGNGLETSLFMALIAFAGAAYFWDDTPLTRIACGVFIGLAVLTRPEGALLAPAVLVLRWLERPEGEPLAEYVKDAVRLALPGVIAGLMIVGFSLIVSGTIGGTGSAKLQFFQEDRASLQYKVGVAADQIGLFLAPVIPLVVLAAITAGRRAALLLVFFWVPILAFYVVLFPGGLAHYFYRYQHPVLPFLAAFGGAGAAYLIALAFQRDIVVKALVVLGLIAVVVPMWEQYGRWRNIYSYAVTETYVDLEAMAIDLNSRIRPDETLATHDIGAVQYFADYKVIDMVGLANDEVIEYHEERRLQEYLDEVQPDYILIFPDWDIFFLHLNAANTPEKYELVETYEGARVRPQTYMLYRVHYP